ncbi:N-acetylmuramoyl-L-alanine amidase CwlD [Tissierella sp.]|uniref:N-acetylmuramoyl-L-alanine amidase CwlD n=1 Tax=Tissierella sp. TaxID=41274 RepID=UPI002854F31A|nr:N-acetylmuramoyl-L-alanine amidase CwlD [Tissierella sp.]MDR7857665.1 N-acetylmuramoyl-L-alanine amidase CwlD [Tissierella sp.]
MRIIIIRKKYLLLFIMIIFMIIGYRHISQKGRKAIPVTYLPISNKIIVIDPGHGGVDPGAVSKNGVKEDEINLIIALKLKRLIEQSGGIVIMTRETDKGLYTSESKTLRQMKTEDLHNRKKLIDASESDVFISIHLNSFIRSTYYGAQTFYKEDSKESENFALTIQKELRNILDKENNRQPQHRDDVFLLNEVSIPSVLVECGFLSNSKEEELLIDETYQEKIAWSIYIGLMNYFSQADID